MEGHQNLTQFPIPVAFRDIGTSAIKKPNFDHSALVRNILFSRRQPLTCCSVRGRGDGAMVLAWAQNSPPATTKLPLRAPSRYHRHHRQRRQARPFLPESNHCTMVRTVQSSKLSLSVASLLEWGTGIRDLADQHGRCGGK